MALRSQSKQSSPLLRFIYEVVLFLSTPGLSHLPPLTNARHCVHPNHCGFNRQAREEVLDNAIAEARADVRRLWGLSLARARALAAARNQNVRTTGPKTQITMTTTQSQQNFRTRGIVCVIDFVIVFLSLLRLLCLRLSMRR